MIELFYSQTPNGRKISIMLEEAKIKYKITPINLSKDEQLNQSFLRLIHMVKFQQLLIIKKI